MGKDEINIYQGTHKEDSPRSFSLLLHLGDSFEDQTVSESPRFGALLKANLISAAKTGTVQEYETALAAAVGSTWYNALDSEEKTAIRVGIGDWAP